MHQSVPIITESDIKRLIRREFPQPLHAEVEDLLETYNSASGDGGKYRVSASILKLSKGDIESIKKYILKANNDFRDVLAPAEYTNLWKLEFGWKLGFELSEERKRELYTKDWEQYEAWLNKK
jgi:hypothetical protein